MFLNPVGLLPVLLVGSYTPRRALLGMAAADGIATAALSDEVEAAIREVRCREVEDELWAA